MTLPLVGATLSCLRTSLLSLSYSGSFWVLVAHKAWVKLFIKMDQVIINGIQHFLLTKEEEEEISILAVGRSNLLEECALSLFGRLLADRHQNTRALKSTLRSAWKIGLDFRIVDVGRNVFQLKFSSNYQLEWVERNGPWNFENNLLLLCRWRKGLSVDNISFTHSPFWVQIWVFPLKA